MTRSLFLLLISAAPAFGQAVAVSPAAIEIKHHRHPHAIQVLGTTADGFTVDQHSEAKFSSSSPNVATVDERGWVRPVASGETQITIAIAGQVKNVPVKVTLPAIEPPTSFRHEVMPVLTRAGCNAGACHGYSLGKNGFKLSLRGESPEQDWFAIVRDSSARRLSFQTPSASLLVTKARGESNHEGGTRFTRNSLSDQILNSWIAQGAPDDLKDPSRVIGVRLIPDKLVLKPNQKHRLQLIADYADGTHRDVTRLGIFTANNDLFATTSEECLVVGGAAGETAIVGRFERLFSATGVTVLDDVKGFTAAPIPAHLVDKPVIEKLNRLKLNPSPLADDEMFLRRIHLDLIGVQPKPEEIAAFVEDKDPKKREKLVDALFARPEFVDHWSLKWGDLLQNSRNAASSPAVFQFREFIRGAVSSNLPMDEFARKILTSRGGASDDPASAYFAISKDVNDTVERATQVFCGVRMLCARCHSHPMENWTQADYFGIASFFTQVSAKGDPRTPNVPNAKVIALNLGAGFATNPRTGQLQPPKFLGGEVLQTIPNSDRREAYAMWLTSAKNPFFARGLTNRIWSYFFHRGIIDPVDDIRSTNPPINPALLEALTADFVQSKFDLRHLIRRIVTSETYQRSSVPNENNKSDEQNFSHAIPRRVPAEALLDSLVQATGIQENIGGAPGGFRAAQLPDANITSDFLRLFGKPQRMDACECERDNGSNMLQALHFINGKSILGRVQNGGARPALLLAKKSTDDQLVMDIYLWSLARKPNAKELKLGVQFIAESGPMQRTAAAQDLMWALLNSKDFLLVH